MQLKNNRPCNVQFFFLKKKDKECVQDFVHIPGDATVELDDDIWAAIRKSKTEIEVMEERVVVLDKENVGANVELGDEKYTIKEYYLTGERKTVSLVDEMVKRGELSVVTRPQVTMEVIDKVLTANGIAGVKEMPEDAKLALYDKLA